MPTVDQVLREAVAELKASDAVDHWPGKERIEAEDLLGFVLGLDGDEPDGRAMLAPQELGRFRRLVARRATGEPAAYITGRIGFMGLSLQVGPGAFIPRVSSEHLVVSAHRRLARRPSPVHVDLATGVGPVALVVAARLPRAEVFGVDLSARPVAMARRNAAALRLRNARFLRGDLFAPLPRRLRGRVDVVTIHPPYVGRREVRTLPMEIRGFEPAESLTDRSPRGLGLIDRVTAEAPAWLRPNGWLLVEVSPDRSRAVKSVLQRAGFRDVRSTKGEVAVSRVIAGRSPTDR
jgi:release factor glutamine methyltransferase